ncbi:hypothetical protein UK23_20290 [Lentzea aerocolonigenes]|uniref:Uncharacterized protein n=1 Tax=Lentzea aerocolonigenes TaxID=68170 RepID=A0A0F0GW40_LENAE|nr:hypothetical protein UK23_20290 [Lentzea aerocolonigenes]
MCRGAVIGPGDNADVCNTCQSRPDWEALPQAVRDEVGAMIDATSPIRAGYLLAELAGGRLPTMEYMKLASYGSRALKRTCSCAEADYGHASWTCPSCDRPLLGCDHNQGEICEPCGRGPGWEALPRAVRNEVGALADAGAVCLAIERLRELDHSRLDSWDYTLMVAYQNRRNSSGSMPRNAS